MFWTVRCLYLYGRNAQKLHWQTRRTLARVVLLLLSSVSQAFFLVYGLDFTLFKKLSVPYSYCLRESDYCIVWHTKRIGHLDKSMTLLSVTHVEGLCIFGEKLTVVNRSYSWFDSRWRHKNACDIGHGFLLWATSLPVEV
jgi:hypothetical protein